MEREGTSLQRTEQPLPDHSRPLGGEYAVVNRFLFELDGLQVGVFKQVQGLQVSVAVETVNEGGQNQFSHQLPGRMTWPNITLRRGITESNALFEWLTQCSGEGLSGKRNKLVRRNGSITAMDSEGTHLRAWNLLGVFPVRWKGPDFSVDATDVLEEELEITHQGFQAVKPSPKPLA